MFGSEYYKHPEILMDSLEEMSGKHKKKLKKKTSGIILFLEKIYLLIFGIPEIGFQVRSQYFREMLEKGIKNKKIKKVLDAGSGIGIYSFWLSKKFKDSVVDGWEIDKTKLEFSKRFAKELNIKNINFIYGDVTKSSLRNKNIYDLIVNIDVLEHIDNFEDVLKNFHKLLSKGGYLFIHTPQIDQKRIFKSLENWHHEGHVHEGFSPSELKKTLTKIGFENIWTRETFGFFGKLAWELNHLILPKGFVILGIMYPFLYLISTLDMITKNKNGLGTAVLVKKMKNINKF